MSKRGEHWIAGVSCVAAIVAALASVAAVVIASRVARHDLRADQPRLIIDLGWSGVKHGPVVDVTVSNAGDLPTTIVSLSARYPGRERHLCGGPGLYTVASDWPPPDWPHSLGAQVRFREGQPPLALGVGEVVAFHFSESEIESKAAPERKLGRRGNTPAIYLGIEDGAKHCYEADLTPIWHIFKCFKEGTASFEKCFFPPLHTRQPAGEAGQKI